MKRITKFPLAPKGVATGLQVAIGTIRIDGMRVLFDKEVKLQPVELHEHHRKNE